MKDIARLLPASGIRKFFDLANTIQGEGETVHRLEIGRPDWKIPKIAQELVTEAMSKGHYHYVANRGEEHLRKVLSDKAYSATGIMFDYNKELIVTTGASEGLAMCALALLEHGDEVIIPEPAWSHYKTVTQLAGAKPIPVSLSSNNGFIIDPELIKKAISPKTKLLIINTPNNPTGAIQPPDVLHELAELSEKYGFYILSDEVYDHFVYNGQSHFSMAEIMKDSDKLIYLNSLSKTYGVTGWRIGYICCSPEVSDALNRIHQYLTVCGVSTVQYAAAKMLESAEIKQYLKDLNFEFQKRCDVWSKNKISCANFSYTNPSGAFYIFPKFNYKDLNSNKFCEYMLEKHHVCMVPGSVFGDNFDNHVRISFSGKIETQQKAKKIIFDTLGNNGDS